jgi:hypothetical protein
MYKLSAMIVCVLASVVLPQRPSMANPSINVLVAVTPGPYGDDTDPVSTAFDFEYYTTEAMLYSGMPLKHFDIRGYVPVAAPGIGSSPEAAVAIAAIELDYFLQTARDNAQSTVHLGLSSYDLVILLTAGLKNNGNNICGYAQKLSDVSPVPFNARENNYIAIVNVNCDMEIVVSHELGHLLGGDHQTEQPSGYEFGDDLFENDPVPYNHPIVNYDVGNQVVATSLMASGRFMNIIKKQFSTVQGTLIDTSGLPAGNADADMRKMIELVWGDVAAYRPLPAPPDEPSVHVMFMFCDYKTPRFDVTWSNSNPDIPVDFFEGQRQFFGSSSWQPWYTGGQDCLITNGSIGGVDYRIRGVNQVGAGPWFTVTLSGCEGGGGPGPN